MKVTAIFDIGKTNKKFFLFDSKFQQVYKDYAHFEEIKDEDGFPCDDITTIQNWLQKCLKQVLKDKRYNLQAINFSTYGASLVHLDKHGKPVSPLYNYLKPMPKEIIESFYQKYGDELRLAKETASPPLAMLNSGLQLYWLKYAKPKTFRKIRWSLHFPQYLSYLLTSVPLSEYTSIGCHTGLWDYAKKDYHKWVYAEELDRILPPIVPSDTSINIKRSGAAIKVGVGVHDSSAALVPYLRAARKSFLLLSTGTWSICLNPFNHELLRKKELKQDCLNYMQRNGKPVKASRLFLGHEYHRQTNYLAEHFGKPQGYDQSIKFDKTIYRKIGKLKGNHFHFESISLPRKQPKKTNLKPFTSYEEAYHQLMQELIFLQIEAAERAIGQTKVDSIYIDGGFAENEIYIKLLAHHFQKINIRTTQSPLGSALGAAILVSQKNIGKQFLKENYSMEKHKAKILID
ncbi:MAG: FGGY-family carbohydrate kinase [Bacteroidia bacterium]